MPSPELAAISDDIENLKDNNAKPIDSLAKFYLYAAVMSRMTVRDHRSFEQLLPVDNRIRPSWQTTLVVGNPSGLFHQKLNNYRTQFEYTPSEFSLFSAAKKIVLAYFRKGQLADLAFINERMLAHLDALPTALDQNRSLYDSVGFETMKPKIRELLMLSASIYQQGFSCVDNGIGAGLSIAVAMLGLIAVVSMTHVLLGVLAMAAGGVAAYAFIMRVQNAFIAIQPLLTLCTDTATRLYQEAQGVDLGDNSLMSKTVKRATQNTLHKDFIAESIIVPLSYTSVTIAEQLELHIVTTDGRGSVLDEGSFTEYRTYLDRQFNITRN